MHTNENVYLNEICATQDGIIVPIEEVPDDVISTKILGDGVAVLPTNNNILSPVDGVIVNIAESKHAFCIQTSLGLDLLVHIGVDTVELNGKGFEVFVSENDTVKKGDIICKVDLDLLKKNNLSTHTAIIITNHNDFAWQITADEKINAGQTIITYEKNRGA